MRRRRMIPGRRRSNETALETIPSGPAAQGTPAAGEPSSLATQKRIPSAPRVALSLLLARLSRGRQVQRDNSSVLEIDPGCRGLLVVHDDDGKPPQALR